MAPHESAARSDPVSGPAHQIQWLSQVFETRAGPKLRVGQFSSPEGVQLETGSTFRFDLNEAKGSTDRVLLPHPEIIEASEVGHVLLIDDGKVRKRNE